jgi:predicted transcriptional regulator of viral defense system
MLIFMSNVTKRILKLTSSPKTVFTVADLAIFWETENKNVLRVTISRAKSAGYLQSIQRGLYALTNANIDLFELAGKLKKHSYISFETVLTQSGVIFQWHNEIISASDNGFETENSYGKFTYRKLPESALLDNIGIINTENYFIASAERALCDKIYKDGLVYFDDLSGVDGKLAMKISKIYHNKRLEKDIKKLFSL